MAEPTSARAVIDSVAVDFVELATTDPDVPTVDGPIGWPGYDAARERAHRRTGETESVVCGTGRIGTSEAVLIAFEFGYLGGSVGHRTGNKIDAAFTEARRRRLPVVTLIATGGSRMQEGMCALSQLHRMARQSALTRDEGLAQIAVLRDPTTGGGWATLGAGADVTLASSGAQVGFAGSRVRPHGDTSAYTAQGQLESGHVDHVHSPEQLPDLLRRWVELLTAACPERAQIPAALGADRTPESGWESVRLARASTRPRAESYLDSYFTWREEISGDRCGGRDPGVRCGLGSREGTTIAYAAQCGTATEPAGFRTAARLIRLADRLDIPILTIVDTPGAANHAEAERAGIGPAISELFGAVASASVPITTLVVGEGGSGGALAFAAPEHTWVTPDSYFSVTSPEAAASILKREADEVPATANQLRLHPTDLVELGIARGIVAATPPE